MTLRHASDRLGGGAGNTCVSFYHRMISKTSRKESRNRWDKRQYATYLVALQPTTGSRLLPGFLALNRKVCRNRVRERCAPRFLFANSRSVGPAVHAFHSLDNIIPEMSASRSSCRRRSGRSVQRPTGITWFCRPPTYSAGGQQHRSCTGVSSQKDVLKRSSRTLSLKSLWRE